MDRVGDDEAHQHRRYHADSKGESNSAHVTFLHPPGPTWEIVATKLGGWWRLRCSAGNKLDLRNDQAAASNTMRAAFSPIIIDGALVLPEVSVGMIEASATRKPDIPRTRRRSSTTAAASLSLPILQVPTGWY